MENKAGLIANHWKVLFTFDKWCILAPAHGQGRQSFLAHMCTESYPFAGKNKKCWKCGALAPEIGMTILALLR